MKGNGNVIEGCRVRAGVSTIDNYCGGIVGHAGTSQLTVKGCVLTEGCVIAEDKRAGTLIGWSDQTSKITLKDCFDMSTNDYPLVNGLSKNINAEKAYYTNANKTSEAYGKIAYQVTAGENVSMNSADPVTSSYKISNMTFRGDDPSVDTIFSDVADGCEVRIPRGNETYDVVDGLNFVII